ncbi:unnamed protein product [Aphis gossypii]|uniref:PWWP domain-containing protein n=1 Tax=Aphis gossypii TaxID=80765 RepID=A0A9P0NHG6_APHGO|nr:unnamed protein product [Aphis gossypii]
MSQVSTTSYPYGTLVWVKVVNRYWWPGIVVDPQTIPSDLLEYVNNVNPIAVVHYEYENKYEVVEKQNNICLYSGPHKNDYIAKGLTLYKNQKKGIPTVGKYDMEAFKEDILSMEKRIGGDVNIFETIRKNQEEIKLLINSNFTPSKIKGHKKEKVVKEAVKVVPKSRGKSLPTPKSQPNIKTKESPSISQPKQNRTSKQKSSPPSKVVKLHTPIRTAVTNGYTCHVHVNCTFKTNSYDILKRHMATCKNDLKEVTVEKLPNAKKRKNIKNKSSEAKKIKLQEELLKDWDNDGEDDDVEFDKSNVQSTSEVAPTIAKVTPTTSEVLSINSEFIPTTTSEDLPNTTSEVLPSTTSDEVLPTISNEIQETNTTFDFNKNDDNTTVVEPRQNESDCNSTVNVMNDKFELQVSSDIKSIETARNESLLVEKIEDPSIEPREIHSNEFTNEIDDQTKTTDLLLEKTVNTLDQINNFESSLSDISNTLNKSDSNILTKDNNIGGVHELSGFDSLKKPTSPNKEVHTKIDNSIDIVEKVEIMSIQVKNPEVVEEKTNDTEIVPNDVEVNHPNDTKIDTDMPIENSCSVDNISNRMDSEDEITAEKDGVKYYLKGIEPGWIKENNWQSHAVSGLKEGNDFVRLWNLIPKSPNYRPILRIPESPANKPEPFNPVLNSGVKNDPKAPILVDFQRILVPIASLIPVTEELRNEPRVQAFQAIVDNGGGLEYMLKRTNDIIKLPNNFPAI